MIEGIEEAAIASERRRCFFVDREMQEFDDVILDGPSPIHRRDHDASK